MENKKSIFLKISSHDAIVSQSTSDSNFVVSATSDILQQVAGVRVRSVAFRNTFDNITIHNNSFAFETNTTFEVITLHPGYYNATEFMLALVTEFNLIPALSGTTIVLGIDKKITITTPNFAPTLLAASLCGTGLFWFVSRALA